MRKLSISSCFVLFALTAFAPLNANRPRSDAHHVYNTLVPEIRLKRANYDLRTEQHHAQKERESVSPYEIRSFVVQHNRTHKHFEHLSLKDYWHRLGIELEPWQEYGYCKANIFVYRLNDPTTHLVLLRLYDDSGWSQGGTRYLIFNRIETELKTKWRLIDHIDLHEQRYKIPSHRLISSGSSRWLVIKVLWGRGTGYADYGEQWYEISENGTKQVLGYPSEKSLFTTTFDPVIGSHARILGVTTWSQTTGIIIELNITYSAYLEEKYWFKLWGERHKVTFVRDSNSGEFMYDEGRSDLTENELNSIYIGMKPSNEYFLRRYYSLLEKIATRGSQKKKQWLRVYLDRCTDTPEKERLLKFLGG